MWNLFDECYLINIVLYNCEIIYHPIKIVFNPFIHWWTSILIQKCERVRTMLCAILSYFIVHSLTLQNIGVEIEEQEYIVRSCM